MWLTARITGPVRGMCSRPSTRTLPNARAAIRASERDHPDEHRLVVVELHRPLEDRGSLRGRPAGLGGRMSVAAAVSASLIAASTMPTVRSKVFPSVLTITASSAARSGATARLRSWSSRTRSCSRTASASSPAGSSPRSSIRRDARSSTDASRNSLRSASGKHDRADVAARGDDPAAVGEGTLARQQRCPDIGDARHGGHGGVDLRSARRLGRVDAVEEDPGQPAGSVVGERDPVRERDEAGRIVHRDALAQRGGRERAVEQARVHEPQAEAAGRGGPDAALAARRRSVERDDDAPPGGGLRGTGAGT